MVDILLLSLSLSLSFSHTVSLVVFRSQHASDQNCVKTIYEKLSRLYNRIIKSHENLNNMIESIRIWGKVPLYQRREGNVTSLLDIDDRSLKCKTRCAEVSNSKKLIEYTMEENFRLLYGLPSLERKKEFGKDRLRNTIIRKFGRHQTKEKIERLPSVVRHFINIYWTKILPYLIQCNGRLQFVFLSSFLFYSLVSIQYTGWIATFWLSRSRIDANGENCEKR